jgi:hypothetical protein
MSDNYFEHSTVALGTIVSIVLIAIVLSLVFFG